MGGFRIGLQRGFNVVDVIFQIIVIQMINDYDRLLREFNVPAGVLTNEELRMLQEGGIRLDDTEQDNLDLYAHDPNQRPNTIPRIPRYQQQNVESESLRQIYEEQISMKDKQISFMQGQLRHREQLMEAERHRLESQYQLQQEKILSELRQARSQVIRSEGQIPLIKQALGQVREMLTGLSSEAVYLRLKDIPEKQLPPSEWLMVNVWELVYPIKKESEYSKKQVTRLRDEVKIMGDKQHSLLNQLEHYSRLLSSKDDDVKRHALNYDNNRKCMELEIEKLREEVELSREKGARYDEVVRDYQFVKQEKELIQEKIGFYDKQAGQSSTVGKMGHDQTQRRKLDLLGQDKEYLTKENIQLIEKNRRLQDRLDRLEAELLAEKNRSQEYLHQLLNLKTDSVSGYEQRIYRQISELKEKHTHELQMAKNNLVDIYEKQLRFLKEALEEKQLKLEMTERQLREKNKEYEQLMMDTRDFQRKFDGDLSETRIQLKIRSEELERISNIYQETLGNLNGHKLQNEMLREKLNVVKGEYYRSEANGKDQLSNLKAQVAVLREQLANYELIEKEVDQAVMSLAKISPNDQGIFANTLNSVPTANKRRIQQALGLAQRLQAKQKEHEQTIQLLRKREQELQTATDELKIARSLLDKSSQPYSYLVANIEEKEKEVLMLRAENKKNEQGYQNLKEEYRELKRQLEEAERDVQRLLVKRESIKNIQAILVDLTRGPTTATQINAAVEDIREILGSTGMRKTGPLPDSKPEKPTNEQSGWYKKLIEKRGQ